MKLLVSAMLTLAGLIHLLPLPGLLGGAKLSALYGLPLDEPNLAILMRHRAVLFGLIGAFLLYAAFAPQVQVLALVAGLVSVVSFLALAWETGGYNAQIGRVVAADVVALVCLLVASAALTTCCAAP
jgi:hypothetical protein